MSNSQWNSDQAIGERALREDAERCRKCRAGKSMADDGLWEKVARDRFLSVYGATIAVQWAAHVREGRGIDESSIRRFISEARALAQWTEEVQHV
jgi:hypothetical protein